jgi:hypothetical protein
MNGEDDVISGQTPDITEETLEEIRHIQRESDATLVGDLRQLEDVPNPSETSTISVRLPRRDVEAIAALAVAQDVPVSHILRRWIADGLAAQPAKPVADAVEACHQAIEDLRLTLRDHGIR